MFQLDTNHVYKSCIFDNIWWLKHGFGTRLATEWSRNPRLTSVRQIHSDNIVISDGAPGLIGDGDSIITNRVGTLLSIRTADCLPILIADVRNRAVAAVHAGWRGTLAAIAPKTVRALQATFGSRLSDLWIAIGPGIGPCCFEVGPEVAVQFETLFPERMDLNERTSLDLAESNRRQLITECIRPEQIDTANLCTCCNSVLFDSYRRDREQSGRMVAAIGISE